MWSAFALGASSVAALFAASPAPTPVQAPDAFEWYAPSECPSTAEVRVSVEQHLGEPLRALESGWSVVGHVIGEPAGGWSLTLVIETAQGRHERPLHDPHDCAAVADAAALLIALALDPQAEFPAPQPAPTSGDPIVTSAPQPIEDPATMDPGARDGDPVRSLPEPRSPQAHDERVRFALGGGPGLDWGALPRVAPTANLHFAVLTPRARVAATAAFGLARGVPVFADATTSLWLWSVGLVAGPVLRAGPLEFPLMLGVEAGQQVAWPAPSPLLNTQRRRAPWAAAFVGPGVAWAPLRALALVANVAGSVSLTRNRFSLQRGDLVHKPAAAGIRASVALELRFPLGAMKSARGGNQRLPEP